MTFENVRFPFKNLPRSPELIRRTMKLMPLIPVIRIYRDQLKTKLVELNSLTVSYTFVAVVILLENTSPILELFYVKRT